MCAMKRLPPHSRLLFGAKMLVAALCAALPAHAQTPAPPTAPPPNAPPPPPIQPGATTPQASSADPASNAPGALFDNRLPMLDPAGGLLRLMDKLGISKTTPFSGHALKNISTRQRKTGSKRAPTAKRSTGLSRCLIPTISSPRPSPTPTASSRERLVILGTVGCPTL